MIYLYIISILFIIFGAVGWIYLKTITWKEWAIGSLIAGISAGAFHGIAYFGQTADEEMWRGKIVQVVHYPRWIEEYEEAVYKTVRDGDSTKTVFSHYVTRHRTHDEYWEAKTNISLTKTIDSGLYREFGRLLSDTEVTERVFKSGFDSGDPNIYYYNNDNNVIIPVNGVRTWVNKLKAAPSVYDFSEVSEEQRKHLYEWPVGNNWLSSGTLLGLTNGIDLTRWDQLGARLGPLKQCNLILIGFPSETPNDVGQWQQAYWKGGKKNDIVITAAVGKDKIEWVYAFGWSQNAQIFAELESIVLNNGLTNEILPKIETAVIKHYQRKEWADFKHLSITPPDWVYWLYPIIILLTQGGLYVYFHLNQFVEGGRTFKRWRY